MSSTIAAVVMEASAPSVDNLPVALMELLREQCLLLHHASSPLYRAEQLQAANQKSSILHALELSDSCDTAKNALTLALYNSPMPSSSPIHPQQPPPPPYQQHQQNQQPNQQNPQQQHQQQPWNAVAPAQNPYMPFNPAIGGFPQPGYNANMHPMSASMHSPTMPIRGRPPTPSVMAGNY